MFHSCLMLMLEHLLREFSHLLTFLHLVLSDYVVHTKQTFELYPSFVTLPVKVEHHIYSYPSIQKVMT